ncbi:MAG: 6-carboxytetrahydropterin synthase [Myxococcales bacterium]|nr:6-carboxytetrahydropterin synthase [Myxococcales bacterium]MCB9736383.1 6-carboxytetrahydropterin synthase [Deltaproteobacteria bacterium]
MTLTHTFRFEAARRLPRLPPEHPCARLHGHGFVVEVEVGGELDPALGWLVDFDDVARAWAPVGAVLDHSLLNEVDGLDNPTSEHLAMWIWARLCVALPGLTAVSVMETPVTRVTYRGGDGRGVR